MSNKGYHTKTTTGPGGESVWLAEYRGVAGVYGIGATERAAIADLNGDSPRSDTRLPRAPRARLLERV